MRKFETNTAILLLFKTCLCLLELSTVRATMNLTFEPNNLKIRVRQKLPVRFNISSVMDLGFDQSTFGEFQVASENDFVARVVNGTSLKFNWTSVTSENQIFEFDVLGGFTGRTVIRITAWKLPDYQRFVISEYPVTVYRMQAMEMLTLTFTVIMAALTVINTFFMGLQLDWHIILAVFKKPVAPAIGFGCQYIIMPLVATGCAFAFLKGQPNLQFGFFAVGCAPGGGASNFWTLLLDGNLDLSVTMTFCSNVAALAMMPFWLYTLGGVFYAQSNNTGIISIPYVNIILSLLLLIGPVFAGLTLKHFKQDWGKKSKMYLKISTVIIILIAVIFGSISNSYILYLLTWKTVVCGFLLPWIGFALAYVVAALFRQDARNCRTIAIETGIQNAGIVIVLLFASLKAPDSDLALVMPISVIIFTPIPLAVALIVKTIAEYMRKKRLHQEEEKEATVNGNGINVSKDAEILENYNSSLKSGARDKKRVRISGVPEDGSDGATEVTVMLRPDANEPALPSAKPTEL